MDPIDVNYNNMNYSGDVVHNDQAFTPVQYLHYYSNEPYQLLAPIILVCFQMIIIHFTYYISYLLLQ